jgi:hypothetical protein
VLGNPAGIEIPEPKRKAKSLLISSMLFLKHARQMDRLPINRDATLNIFKLHYTKQVHADSFQNIQNRYAPCLTYPAGNRQLERLVRHHTVYNK